MFALSKNGWNKAGTVEKTVKDSLFKIFLSAMSRFDDISGWGEKLSYGNTSKSGNKILSLFWDTAQVFFNESELLHMTRFFW